MRVIEPASGTKPARLRITAIPWYTYLIQRSLNLADWTSISTNTPLANRFEVTDNSPGITGTGYYRVVWTE